MQYLKSNFYLIGLIIVAIIAAIYLDEPVKALIWRKPYVVNTKTAVLSLEKIPGIVFEQMKINVDPGGEPINAVGVTILYDPAVYEVISLNVDNSFCQLFIESEYINAEGKINVKCGLPYPGINQPAEIARFGYFKKTNSAGGFRFSPDSQVLANNGYGTDILKEALNFN